MAQVTKRSGTNGAPRPGSAGRRVSYLSVVEPIAGEPANDSADGDSALELVAFVVGVIIVAAAIVRHAPWGAGATVGLLLCILSGRALVVHLATWVRMRRLRGRR